MPTAEERRAAAMVVGRKLKRKNAITALLCGAVPGLIAGRFLHPSRAAWVLGIIIGLLWSNAFEYLYHRYLLHWPRSSFGQAHLLHHLSTGMPNEPEHVTFGNSPLWVAMLFASNGIPMLTVDCWRGWGVAPGILVGFTLYMILIEEIHWRVHLAGWFPGISWVREYHMAHHDIPGGRYNVFFPGFDFLMGNMKPPLEETQAAMMARTVSYDAQPSALVAAVTQLALSAWMLGLMIGARYFWTTKVKV